MAGLGQEVELVDPLVLQEHLADLPGDAFLDHAVRDPQPVAHFERALGEADRARALADPVVVVEQHDGLPALGEVDGGGKPDRAGPDHDHRVARGRRRVLVR